MLTALSGVLSDADGWVSMVDWAALKLPWLRGYLPFANGTTRMMHLVSARHQSRGLVLGQVNMAAKSNEITAIPDVLDAMHAQAWQELRSVARIECQH